MRFLIIGGGSIGRRHIRNLQILGYSDIYCLKREYDHSFEQEFNVKVLTSTAELEDRGIDAVLVCSPTSMHIDGMKLAARLNASVLMEKPLTNSQEHLSEAESFYAGNKKVFLIGFMLRYHPLVKKIKGIIDSKELGNVYSARFEFGSYLPYWHPWEDHRISYASRKELGGGVINTITHELDLVQFFFGTPLSLYAAAANFNKLEIDVEEISEGILNYEDKIVTLHLDYLQKDYDRNIKILCDEGKIIWNWHDNAVHVITHKGPSKIYRAPEGFEVNDLYLNEIEDFLSILKMNQMFHPLDFKHAVNNTKLMLAMHESVSLRRAIGVSQ